MANATIDFTPKGASANYTIDQINTLFAALAVVINGKMDRDLEGADNTLTGNLGLNLQPVINLAPGVASDDAVTLEQAREILGV